VPQLPPELTRGFHVIHYVTGNIPRKAWRLPGRQSAAGVSARLLPEIARRGRWE